MPGKVPKEVTRQREAEAWQLRQQCWTEARIAAKLGVSQQAVSKILARVDRRVLKDLAERVAAEKAVQVAQLEHIADEGMRAWERSLEDSVTVRTVPAPDGKGEVTEHITKTQCGNPALLAQVRGALADIREILGIGGPGDVLEPDRPTHIEAIFQDALQKVYGPGSPYGPQTARDGPPDAPGGVNGRAGSLALPGPAGARRRE